MVGLIAFVAKAIGAAGIVGRSGAAITISTAQTLLNLVSMGKLANTTLGQDLAIVKNSLIKQVEVAGDMAKIEATKRSAEAWMKVSEAIVAHNRATQKLLDHENVDARVFNSVRIDERLEEALETPRRRAAAQKRLVNAIEAIRQRGGEITIDTEFLKGQMSEREAKRSSLVSKMRELYTDDEKVERPRRSRPKSTQKKL